jgi:hypothetical protein
MLHVGDGVGFGVGVGTTVTIVKAPAPGIDVPNRTQAVLTVALPRPALLGIVQFHVHVEFPANVCGARPPADPPLG